MKKSVLVIGALNLDIIIGYRVGDGGLPFAHWGADKERAVDDREWWSLFYSYLSDRPVKASAGGSAANMGAALVALDPNLTVQVAGVVGDDPEADHLLASEHWYDAQPKISIRPGARTGRALSYVGLQGQGRRIAVSPGVNDSFLASDVPLEMLDSVHWLHASPFVSHAANQELLTVLRRAREASPSVVISLDPGTFLTQACPPELKRQFVGECDYLFVKTTELLAMADLTGIKTEGEACLAAVKQLFEISDRRLAIVVERIPKGFAIYNQLSGMPQKVEFSAPLIDDVKDDTGAGDVFDAAFVYSVLRGLSLDKSQRLIYAMLKAHLGQFGRAGYASFATCAPIVFASHSRKDKALVQRFIKMFEDIDVTFWVDEIEIHLGGEIRQAIESGIRSCDIFLIFVTPDSLASNWVQDELAWAKTHGVRVIPVVLANCELPPEIRSMRCLTVMDGWSVAYEHLLLELNRSRNASQ
jgi:sugar/nucleoside kinase (ribokinase family)